jgi:hypothetical protein
LDQSRLIKDKLDCLLADLDSGASHAHLPQMQI